MHHQGRGLLSRTMSRSHTPQFCTRSKDLLPLRRNDFEILAEAQNDVEVQSICIHDQKIEKQVEHGNNRGHPKVQEAQSSRVAPLASQGHRQIEKVHVQQEHAEVHPQECPPVFSCRGGKDDGKPRPGMMQDKSNG